MKQILDEEILCIVPARMGSTRLKNKNIREIEKNFTLVDQAIKTADGFQVCITTDKPDIFKIDNVLTIKRPPKLSNSISNVSEAVAHATFEVERILKKKYKIIITLMPAIACRSNGILKDMINKFNQNINCLSSFTFAETHPWIWKITENNQIAQNTWTPNKQKNSQNLPKYFVEHASIIINKREIINPTTKWKYPLMLYSLPSWAVALDIDTEIDMEHCKKIYPAISNILDNWRGKIFIINDSEKIRPD